MKRYLLDSNIWIYAMNGRYPQVRETLRTKPVSSVLMSAIVWGELAFGWENSARRASTKSTVEQYVQHNPVLEVDAATALTYGRIRQSLQSQGQVIGMNDFWIAAQALTHKLVLVTNNIREFERVPGLKLENWASA